MYLKSPQDKAPAGGSVSPGTARPLTFGALLLALHLLAVLLQLAVGERGEGVGAGGAHDDVGLVLLLDDGLGSRH